MQPKDNAIYIYALRDPRTQRIRYVGSTNNLARRHYAHINSPHGQVAAWTRELRSVELQPIMEVLEETTEEDRQSRESHWISYLRLENELLNALAFGGGHTGPEKHTISYRLTPEALELLALIARRWGLNRSEMLEMIIRQRAKAEGL